MKNNIMAVESIQVFKHKSQAFGNKTMTNYELIMQGLMTHLFPQNALQLLKRYLLWVLFKPRYSNIIKFIWRINEIVEYIENFPTFRTYQELSDNKII